MTPARRLSTSLSAYLCGTHSGMLVSRRGERLDHDAIARAHRALAGGSASAPIELGGARWEPAAGARRLAEALRRTLDDETVIDLVLFGSQARGSTTGFSDVDAILVITDEAAEDPAVLHRLRPRVLAAQRAVIAHQPMQHHAFEVATPKLLSEANETLRMPAVVFAETRSLNGSAIEARFAPDPPAELEARLAELASQAAAASAWPRHPWNLHVLVSMFELLPVLFLQARGRHVPKWRSFAEARAHFGDRWWPYDVLEQVRETWVRHTPRGLRAAIPALRNPWLAIAVWRRLPAARPQPARRLLSQECLEGLRGLAREMGDRAS